MIFDTYYKHNLTSKLFIVDSFDIVHIITFRDINITDLAHSYLDIDAIMISRYKDVTVTA